MDPQCVAQAGLELSVILLLHPSECWITCMSYHAYLSVSSFSAATGGGGGEEAGKDPQSLENGVVFGKDNWT